MEGKSKREEDYCLSNFALIALITFESYYCSPLLPTLPFFIFAAGKPPRMFLGKGLEQMTPATQSHIFGTR